MNICVIPARGGSKRIPKKNIKDFLGKPIIAYSIQVALKSKLFDAVLVSTDDNDSNVWADSVEFVNDELSIYNPGPLNLTVLVDQHGNGDDWNVSNDFILLAGETTVITAIAPSTGHSFAWLENNDGIVELHLATHEV